MDLLAYNDLVAYDERMDLVAHDLDGNRQHPAGSNLLIVDAAEALPCGLRCLVRA